MSAKRRKGNQQGKKIEDIPSTLSDSLNDEVLAKLKSVKNKLSITERENEDKRQEKLRLERKEREKNKCFEELLNDYGDIGKKY